MWQDASFHLRGHQAQGQASQGADDAPGRAVNTASQYGLYTRFSPPGGGATPDPAAPQLNARLDARLDQRREPPTMGRLYGSVGQLAHIASRASLPDILEEPSLHGGISASAGSGSSAPLPGARTHARSLSHPGGGSEDDLFGMDLGSATAGGAALDAAAPQPHGPPAVPDLSLVGQMPSAPAQSRTLLVRGVDAGVSDDELHTLFEAFGEIRSLYTAVKHRGMVVVSYFDLRAAALAQHTLRAHVLRGRALDVCFSAPTPGAADGSLGMLLVLSPDGSCGLAEAQAVLSRFGELRIVQAQVPGQPGCVLVEYYDVRHAAAALAGVPAMPELVGRLLCVEAGGGAGAEAPLGGSLPRDYGAGFLSGNAPPTPVGMRTVGSSPAMLAMPYTTAHQAQSAQPYQAAHQAQQAAARQQVQAAAAQMEMLLGGGGGGPRSVGPGGYSGADLAGMSRSLSELSLDGGGGMAGRPGASMSANDMLALAAGLARGGGSGSMRGAASTPSLWAPQQGSLGSSPLGGGGGGGGWMHDPYGQQRSQHAAVAALQQQAAAAASAAALLQQQAAAAGLLHCGNAAVTAALQRALLQQQAAALMGGGSGGAPPPGGASARRGETPLGGRLARRPLDPMAEAERRAQQDKLYSLDIVRITSGEDRRTTLMIKNIPNKYTQRMLLQLIEERFRGHFDFFYLPIDFKNKCNVGYAFINMVRPAYIPALVEELHGRRWPRFNSEKVCSISYGRIQGKSALVQHFQNSSLLHEDKRCRPVLFHTDGDLAGEPEGFPAGAAPPGAAPP